MNKKYYNEHQFDYFEYKGVKYKPGTKFKTKVRSGKVEEVVFVGNAYNNPESIEINYRPAGCSYSRMEDIKKADIDDRIIEMIGGDYLSEFERKKHYLKESDVPEVVYGWIVYIFVMCLITIFNDRWIGWIGVSIYFFSWKKKKMEEAYYYDD